MPSDNHISVGIAIRPDECVIKHGRAPEIRAPISSPAACMDFIRSNLHAIGSGKKKVHNCVISMFGDIDTQNSMFFGSALGHEEGAWQEPIYFVDELGSVFTGENKLARISIYNDATLSAYLVFQAYKKELGAKPFLLITVREWGIGFGLIYQGEPWSFGRNPELAHIPTVKREIFVQGRIIRDFDPNPPICSLHNGENFSCIGNLASGAAAKQRDGKGIREQLIASLGKKIYGHEFEAMYLAQACVAGAAAYSPERIVLTGAYLNADLVELVRRWFNQFTKGFPRHVEEGFLSYASAVDADVDGADLYASEIARNFAKQPVAPRTK